MNAAARREALARMKRVQQASKAMEAHASKGNQVRKAGFLEKVAEALSKQRTVAGTAKAASKTVATASKTVTKAAKKAVKSAAKSKIAKYAGAAKTQRKLPPLQRGKKGGLYYEHEGKRVYVHKPTKR
jgi:hypothetical protein